jgi:hypothetical protein
MHLLNNHMIRYTFDPLPRFCPEPAALPYYSISNRAGYPGIFIFNLPA